MGMLTSIVSRTEEAVVFECRSCGTTVDGREAACPYCGPTDVVRYEVR